jgi:hypothetical protein
LKELIEKLFGALPAYSRQMVALFVGPKRAILQMDLESDSATQEALTFLAVSFGIAFIAQIPFFADKQDKEVLFGYLAVVSAFSFAMNVAAAIVVWKIVGGKKEWKKVVLASCYAVGVSTLIFLAGFLIGAGTFKFLDPVAYPQAMSGVITDPQSLQESGGLKVYLALTCLALLATYVWIWCFWGAYRELLQLSKQRSAVALLLYMAVSPWLILVQMLMMFAIVQLRAGPAVPKDLVGDWQAGLKYGTGETNTIETMEFKFGPPSLRMLPMGEFLMIHRKFVTTGKCLVVMTQMEHGNLFVHESTMELVPYERKEGIDDPCAKRVWENPTPFKNSEYQYKIDEKSVPWTLCLSSRIAELCLKPKQ